MGEAIVVHELVAGYPRRPAVLDGIDALLLSGSFTAVIGPNGSGKSTFLRVLAGLLKPTSGTIRLGEFDPHRARAKDRARRIAYLPQNEADEMPYTAFELVLMGRFPYQGFLPIDRPEDFAAAERALDRTGALMFADRRLAELSGGERQRVHLARALAQEPELLLLDEPAAALDLRHQVETYRLLDDLRKGEGKTLVVVSHDLNLPAAFADRILVLKDGKLVAEGPPEQVLRAAVLAPVFETEILEATLPGGSSRVLFPNPRG